MHHVVAGLVLVVLGGCRFRDGASFVRIEVPGLFDHYEGMNHGSARTGIEIFRLAKD